MVTKLENSNFNKTHKLKLQQNLINQITIQLEKNHIVTKHTTQNVTKLKPKLRQNL